jgi:hypothetical protein
MALNLARLLPAYTAGLTYAQRVAALNPLLWLRNRETSGTNAANSGSAGATLDGTIGGTTTLGQTGQLGANEAFDFDGATSLITVANNAALAALTSREICFLCNMQTKGESSVGTFFNWGDSLTNRLLNVATDTLQMQIDLATTDATTTLANSSINIFLNKWAYLFFSYDDTTKLISAYYGLNGVVTEFSYASQVTGVGGITAIAQNLIIGNRQSVDRTFDGLIDEVLYFGRTLTSAERLDITRLAGL